MFPSTSELAFQYKQSTWYQAVTKDLGAERAAGRKQYYVIRETPPLACPHISLHHARALAHHRLPFYGAAQNKENAIKPDSVGVSIIAQVWILILRYSRPPGWVVGGGWSQRDLRPAVGRLPGSSCTCDATRTCSTRASWCRWPWASSWVTHPSLIQYYIFIILLILFIIIIYYSIFLNLDNHLYLYFG